MRNSRTGSRRSPAVSRRPSGWRFDGRRASLASPIQLLALRAPAGGTVTVLADGLDELEALDAICALIAEPPT